MNSSANERGLPPSIRVLLFAVTAALAPGSALAQERPTVAPEDYGRWENLGAAALSPSGRWIAYAVTRVDGKNELRVRDVRDVRNVRDVRDVRAGSAGGDSTTTLPWGQNPRFSPDDNWLAWTVTVSSDERERLEEAGDPVRDGVGLLDLSTGERLRYDGVASFSFDAEGRFLVLHGYPPDEPKGKGADARLIELGTSVTMTFGNVGELAWSETGSLLALTIATGEASGGNGVQLFDADAGRIRTLDSSTSDYRQVAWSDTRSDLAVLRSRGSGAEVTAHDVVAWRGLGGTTATSHVLTEGVSGMPEGHEVVRPYRPRWSDDGTMIAVGLRPSGADEDRNEDSASTVDASEGGAADEATESEDEADGPDLPGVQIWHSADRRVYSQQATSKAADERRSLLAVWHVDDGRVVTIGSQLRGNAQLLGDWSHAVEDLAEPYGWGEMFGRPYHDVWRVDVQTGAREMALEKVRWEWPSAGGGYLVSFDGTHYSSMELETGARHDLSSELPTVFADTAYDTPTDMLPPYGFTPAWLEGDAGVLLNDEHDVWRVALDGTSARRLTSGTEERVTSRIAFVADDDVPGLDPEEPIYLTLHGEWSEQRGFARLNPDGTVERLALRDQNISGLLRADSADVYAFRAMAFDDPPDYFVAGPDLNDAVQATEINPFIAEHAWGRSELVDYVSESGRPLQAVLYYPADYEPGQRVPTIVYTYEMRSQTIHNFQSPSERSYYNFTAWTQHGYAVLQPDIVYTAREPGMSALASVRAAVTAVVDMGVADADAVGLIGHSWGGYQAAFLPTRTDIFAASVAGAPLTDFVSFMGQNHWNSGAPELTHWETGQGRMEVPFWEDPEAHRRNSPIHKVQDLETPMLMAFGNEDGTVDWDQGTEFYNFARRAGKQMVLLVYEGENHGFRQEPNQVDYHRRILEWFGHYLKREPAPDWITDGVKLEDLEDEKRRVAKKGAIS